jgi:hypothetical protein
VVLVAVDVRVFRVLPESHTPWVVAVVAAEVGSDEAATEHHSSTEPGPPEIPVAGWVIQPENVFDWMHYLLHMWATKAAATPAVKKARIGHHSEFFRPSLNSVVMYS